MSKLIYKYEDIKEEVIEALDIITDPIKQTMSPRGGNVICENNFGDQFVTNDGVTIAKNIVVDNPIHNAIIEIVKGSSLKTNMEAGDGTSSTILLSNILTKGGLKLVEKGHNQMDVRDNFLKFAKDIKGYIKDYVMKVNTDNELFDIAKISANNDENIAKDVVKTMKIVAEEGQVLINQSYSEDTDVIEDTGFVSFGSSQEELLGKQGKVQYQEIPVLITDKRIYYKQEAQTILKLAIDNNYESIAIVASDFIGESLAFFIANHQKGIINILLIKESDRDKLVDLATYLGGEIISEKNGSIVNNVKITDLCIAKNIYSDKNKSIISRDKNEKNKELELRIKSLQEQMDEIGNKNDVEYKKLKKRLASLTRGMVTIKVGGCTQLEVFEKIYRYEDAINATRCAMSEGYVVGGGLALFNSFKNNTLTDTLGYEMLFSEVCHSIVKQIAINSGIDVVKCFKKITEADDNIGYNAATCRYEDLLKAGVIEPYKVVKQVIDNAISIANIIVTSRYLIVNKPEEVKEEKYAK